MCLWSPFGQLKKGLAVQLRKLRKGEALGISSFKMQLFPIILILKEWTVLLTQQNLDQEIRGGTTAVVALMHGGVLYVGNVGDSRALLCKKDRYHGMSRLDKIQLCPLLIVHKYHIFVYFQWDIIYNCLPVRSGVLKVKQLTADHTTSSHDEIQRLASLNLQATKIKGEIPLP